MMRFSSEQDGWTGKEIPLTEQNRIIIDSGHGGADPGAVYENRQEKDDNLALALAVGQILSDHGIPVGYTRVTDIYQTPQEKAEIANRWGADYFISIHRNAMPDPGTASGIMSLIYQNGGPAELMAQNINQQLEDVGYRNLGISERPGLIVLRKTKMPAVLIEAGFLDNEADNQYFDQNFERTAQAIADGILNTLKQESEEPEYYQIQIGVYRNRANAERQLQQLIAEDYPAFLVAEDGLYKVRVGAYLNLDNAVWMEKTLRSAGYPTVLVKEKAIS